jgi:hypothetical protein
MLANNFYTRHHIVPSMSLLEVYHEVIWWKLILLLIALVDVPLIASIWYAYSGASPEDPSEVLILVVLLFVITFIVFSFSRFSVVITNSGIAVGFGVSKGRFRWDEVEGCYLDDASAIRYGGFGIKGGVFNGKRRLVYNVTGTKRVVLQVKGRKYDEFVFSTKNPDQVMRLVKMQTGNPA